LFDMLDWQDAEGLFYELQRDWFKGE
jgi:hypothetical protein